MYSIYFKHKGQTAENLLYSPSVVGTELVSAKLSRGMGRAGELEVTIPPTHIEKDNIQFLSDEFIVKRDDEVLFVGRPITQSVDFNGNAKITCEGILAYLCDSPIRPYQFTASQYSVTNFIDLILAYHQNIVEQKTGNAHKTFTRGIVSPSLASLIVKVEKTDEAISSYDMLTNQMIKEFGGYLRVREANGVRYLDYLDSYGTTASQTIETAVNILDVAKNVEYSEVVTCAMTSQKLGDFITDIREFSSNVDQLGVVAKYFNYDDIQGDARQFLAQYVDFNKFPIERVEVKAVDLHLADSSITAFNLGDNVEVTAFGITQTMEISELENDLLNPTNDVISLGKEGIVITGNDERYSFISLQNEINALKAQGGTPEEHGRDLLMPYTASGNTYNDTAHDWTKYSQFELVMRFRSSATSSNWYFQNHTISREMLDGTFGGTSQNGRWNFNYYGSTTSKLAGNAIFNFANQSVQLTASGVTGWENPDFALVGIY